MNKKTVLITGASSGIGMATAVLLHQNGYHVYATSRSIHKMKKLEQLDIKVLNLDVSKEASIATAVQNIYNETGTIDVLINNAGFGLLGPLEEITMEDIRYQFEVNFFGLVRLTQLVIPKMREKKQGTIVNVSSVAGIFGESLGSVYHSSKHAVEGFTSSLWRELKPFGIDVVSILPGTIKTEWDAIALTNLDKTSGNRPYSGMILERQRMFGKLYGNNAATKPEVVAETILTAIRSKNPKMRYLVGNGAKEVFFLKRIFGDKNFYKMMDFFVEKLTK